MNYDFFFVVFFQLQKMIQREIIAFCEGMIKNGSMEQKFCAKLIIFLRNFSRTRPDVEVRI